MNRIAKVGVELEGGFTELLYIQSNKERLWHGDGSVNAGRWSGEIISRPHTDPQELKKWIRLMYPKEVNNTCGFHIHLSFKSNLDYMRLMSKAFQRHFIKMWTRWGEKNVPKTFEAFWLRLQNRDLPGTSRNYCKRGFPDVEKQLNGNGDRYFQLNFCWSEHKTLENRMLPMFKTPELACQAVQHYVDFVDRWLSIQPRTGAETLIGTVEADEDAPTMDDQDVISTVPDEELKETICV